MSEAEDWKTKFHTPRDRENIKRRAQEIFLLGKGHYVKKSSSGNSPQEDDEVVELIEFFLWNVPVLDAGDAALRAAVSKIVLDESLPDWKDYGMGKGFPIQGAMNICGREYEKLCGRVMPLTVFRDWQSMLEKQYIDPIIEALERLS